tara:strand:- start:2 stop:571 length:570 start_codon:yes stop_codon:yes gene_type:complete
MKRARDVPALQELAIAALPKRMRLVDSGARLVDGVPRQLCRVQYYTHVPKQHHAPHYVDGPPKTTGPQTAPSLQFLARQALPACQQADEVPAPVAHSASNASWGSWRPAPVQTQRVYRACTDNRARTLFWQHSFCDFGGRWTCVKFTGDIDEQNVLWYNTQGLANAVYADDGGTQSAPRRGRLTWGYFQ